MRGRAFFFFNVVQCHHVECSHSENTDSETCEHVELDDLKDDVKRSILATALGSDNPCSLKKPIGEGTGEASDKVGDYYWTVTDNTFYAKKDGAPSTTDYDFYIRFDGKEPAVWVEDAEEWTPEKSKEYMFRNPPNKIKNKE